jgi:hypothetical protein
MRMTLSCDETPREESRSQATNRRLWSDDCAGHVRFQSFALRSKKDA